MEVTDTQLLDLPKDLLIKILYYDDRVESGRVCKKFYGIIELKVKKLWEETSTELQRIRIINPLLGPIIRRCAEDEIHYQTAFRLLHEALQQKALECNVNQEAIQFQRDGTIQILPLIKIATSCAVQNQADTIALFRPSGLLRTDTDDLSGNDSEQLLEELIQQCDHLDCYNARMRAIPQTVEQLENCVHMNFSRNALSSLPQELFALKKLTSLDLSHNQLQEIPEEIGNLSLSKLYLYDDCLETLPNSLGKALASPSSAKLYLDKKQFMAFYDQIHEDYLAHRSFWQKVKDALIFQINLPFLLIWKAFLYLTCKSSQGPNLNRGWDYCSIEEIKKLDEDSIAYIEISFPPTTFEFLRFYKVTFWHID